MSNEAGVPENVLPPEPPAAAPAPAVEEDIFEFVFARALDFRQETIYFIIVDRFYDGDKSNNPGPNPELYDPAHQDWRDYWGGDLRGVIARLDYLKRMGITAIWLSPLFEQIERFAYDKVAPIHGYWTRDFKRINSRYLDNKDNPSLFKAEHTVFDELIEAMHKRGMKLILDIVCNHSSPDAGGRKGRLYDDGTLIADFNDDREGWYHHFGEIQNWEDRWQIEHCEISGLATFNENNVTYRRYIIAAIKLWLDRGVDALRIDTLKHMPVWFWQEFAGELQAHKPETFVFGEWGFSNPNNEAAVAFTNDSGINILDFGLCEAIRRALALNDPEGFRLIEQVLELDYRYDRANELVTFVDNHDMNRFLTLNPDPGALRLAVALIMTLRGIPCLYYGTEQYLHNDTNAAHEVFSSNDPYNRPMMERWDESTGIYRDVRILSNIRRRNPAVSRGGYRPRMVEPSIFCFERMYMDSRCFVAMNCGGGTRLQDITVEFPDGEYVCPFSGKRLQVNGGRLQPFDLDHHQLLVIERRGKPVMGTVVVRVRVNGLNTQLGEGIVVIGNCPELGNWDIDHAFQLEYLNSNTWLGEIAFNESAGKKILYKYAVRRLNDEGKSVDVTRENRRVRKWILPPEGVTMWSDKWQGQ